MAKRKNTKNTEDILLELTSTNTDEQGQKEQKSEDLITSQLKEQSSKEELKDLISTNVEKEKALTETDYLVLEQHCLGVDESVICEQYNISKGYFRQILRNSNSSKFIEKWSNNTQQKVLTQSIGNISTGMDLLTKKINKLVAEGKDDLAIREMFGKLSLVEVHEKLAKLNKDEEDDSTAPIQNLFLNLQQR